MTARRTGLVAVLLLATIFLPVPRPTREAAGQPAISSLVTSTPPTIDGALSPGEWSNRLAITMNGYNDPNRTRQADLYLMHDATNLYVAVVFPDSVRDADYLMVDLDDGHDHLASELGDDAMGFGVGERYGGYGLEYEDYRWQSGYWWVTDAQRHGRGARIYDSNAGKYTYEFSKPLRSGDSQDADISQGSVVGFRIEVWDTTVMDWFRYPPDTVDSDTTRWGQWADLTLPAATVDLTASSKRVTEGLASPGQAITYTITLTNTGNLSASARLTDTVPLSTTYRAGSLAASSGSVGYASGVITWTGTVEAARSVVITYATTLSSTLASGALITNTATINNGVGAIFETAPITTTVAAEVRKVYAPLILKGYGGGW